MFELSTQSRRKECLMSLDKIIGEKLMAICKENNMTLPIVSAKTGIKYGTLWAYCKGTRGIDFDTLSIILKVFDVKLSDFVKGIEE